MQKLLSILKNNYWAIFVAFLSTLFVFIFAINGYGIKGERILWNIVFFGILSITCLLCNGWRKKILIIAIAVISFAPNLINQSFLLMDHTILKSTDYWVIFDTNPTEASGFFRGVPIKIFAFAALYIGLLFITVYKSIKYSNWGG